MSHGNNINTDKVDYSDQVLPQLNKKVEFGPIRSLYQVPNLNDIRFLFKRLVGLGNPSFDQLVVQKKHTSKK